MVKRGEIWWADLPEPGFRRPVLVVQSNAFNASRIQTVVAVSITSNLHLADAPGNVRLPSKKTGLSKESVANVSQIVTLDRRFLTEKVGKLDQSIILRVEEGIRLVLDLQNYLFII